jgi:hypothetical protein
LYSLSPRVTGSTSRSRSSPRRGSLLTLLLRPPPLCRMRPSPAFVPSWSSLIPWLMTRRESPIASASTSRYQPPGSFIQFSGYSLVPLLDLFFSFHASQSITSPSTCNRYSLTTPKLYQSDPEILRKMVEDGMSLREIGRALGMASSGVHNACVSFGIARKDRKQQIVAKNCRQISDSLFSLPLNAKESWLLGLLMTDGCVIGTIARWA